MGAKRTEITPEIVVLIGRMRNLYKENKIYGYNTDL